MNFKQTLFALAVGGLSITNATGVHAANTFSFVGSGALVGDGTTPPTGSWYSFSVNPPDLSYTTFRAPGSPDIPGPNGTLNFDVVNTLTLGVGGGSHNSGNMIDRDSIFLGEWTAHSTTGALEITWDGASNSATVNMSNWRWSFNGTTYNLGAGAPALLNNQNGIWGDGDDTLDYATIMTDPFGGVQYGLHLVGSANLMPVPEASTYGMMLAGLGLVGFAVRRKK
jgi:hypothetical protein